jgi:serine/threonine-protein kinase HipA
VLRLLDYVIFNTLIGNHDAHAKNFSLLYISNTPVLAPLYDALSTAVYPSLAHKMAMKIGSKYKFAEVQVRHWDQFAQAAGLSIAQTRKRILDLALQLPLAARKLASVPNGEFTGHSLIEQIISLIEARSAQTIRLLRA